MDTAWRPLFVFVGGFLGAGKTTLILSASRLLAGRGKRVAMITNDQDSALVDTRLAAAHQLAAREVAGGCFCCRFSDLLHEAAALRDYAPDIIFAEPVGSCIDLSATILQPLKRLYENDYQLAPLTVLIDPHTAMRAQRGDLGADLDYLYRHQLAEADLVCVTKKDLYSEPPALSVPIDVAVSGVSGEGVAEWIDELLSGKRVVGARLLEVDYDRYAEAEAALAWLNLHATVRLSPPESPALLCGPLLDRLAEELRKRGTFIAHLKVFDQSPSGWLKASITGNSTPKPEGDLLAEPSEQHEVAINLRALADPDEMRELVTSVLKEIDGDIEIRHLRAFRPARPEPEHRFSRVSASV
jgi:hypothetical protein